MSFLRVDDLHISLGEFYLREVFFSLEKGDYLMIIGPTGAGKTILLESIVGFWKPQQGSIYLEEINITDELPEKRNIGIVYQDYALLPHFTVFDNIAYGLKKKKIRDRDEKIREMARTLNIEHLLHRKPDTLSGGEQQRVALARALIVNPKLLLMDEPFSALDPQTRRETRRLLKRVIAKSNTTVIHISHDLNDAWALANKIAVFREGALLQFGSVNDIFDRPGSPFIANFVGATILQGTAEKNGSDDTFVNVDGMKLASIDNAENGSEVTVAIRPENIIVSKEEPHHLSARNVLETTLKDIVPEGRMYYLHLLADSVELPALVTRSAVEQLEVQSGDRVYAIVKSAHVRIIKHVQA